MNPAVLFLANAAIALDMAAQEAGGLRPDQMPNLGLAGIRAANPYPRPGELVRLRVDIRNLAAQPQQRIPLVLFANSRRVAKASISLGPGQARSVPMDWRAPKIGVYTLTARLDPDQSLPEIDRSDNSASLQVAVRPGTGGNDLVISKLDVIPRSAAGGTIARVSVRNNGTRLAIAPLRLEVDGKPFDLRLVELPPGQTAQIDVPLPKSSSRISFEIDAGTGAGGHGAEGKFAARDLRPPVDIGIEQLSVAASRYSPDRPRQVTLSFRVTNGGREPVAHPFEVLLFPGAIEAGALAQARIAVPALGAGQSLYVSRTIVSPAGEFDVRVEADPAGTIVGDDRSNNVANWRFRNPQSDVDRWVSIGPSRIKEGIGAVGELTSIAMAAGAPGTIYVGSKSAGVWKTADDGATWAPVGDSLPSLKIGGIAMTPSNPLRVYVATADAGMFRSDDGGGTWLALPNSPNGEPRFGALAVSPRDPELVYLATSDGVHRSSDSGASWTLALASGQASDLVMAPDDPTTLYAGIVGDGVYKSMDGGATWARASNGLPAAGSISQVTLASSRGNAGVLYSAISVAKRLRVFRTSDAAATWTEVKSPNSDDLFNDTVGADPKNPDIVYVSGVKLFRSTNGGSSYSRLSDGHLDYHALVNDPVDPKTIYVLSDGGIYKSTDRGDSWKMIGEGLANVEFYDHALAASDPDMTVGGTQDNGTILSNGSLTWKQIKGDDGATVAVDPKNSGIIYAMKQDQKSVSVSYSGFPFLPFSNHLATSGGACINLKYHIHPRTASTLLAPCFGLWRTTTNFPPGNWKQIMQQPAPALVVRSAVDPKTDIYYAGTNDGRIFAGVGGSGWQLVFTHPNAAQVTDIDVDPTDPRRLFVSFDDSGSSIFLLNRTASAPVTLAGQAIGSGIPSDVTVRTLAVDPALDLTVYAGTTKGVYRGRAPNALGPWTWDLYSVGMPLADVRDLEVHPATGVLSAATFGRGAFQVNTVEPMGSLLGVEGRIKFIRVHDVGTGYGPPSDRLDGEVVIWLDSMPGKSFGLQLRDDPSKAAHEGMFSLLRKAFAANRPVRIDYRRTGFRSGQIIRVMLLAP